ncbi:cbb3-type cytochrome c oxidase subunit III [Nitrosomonas nitrosa]|uniref:c-type cytochrome n=1 Tax=Nitrosomonas nitrosa TaxID=52442 RepID=UPI000D3269B7|nr:cytochrome c [Nitrosomonas nitrosa]PTR04817.1 cbb3-type cytochrome c oxidase subunit III [Nitrosomonas nitrosa]
MKMLIAGLLAAVLALVYVVIDTGVYNMAATEKHWAITEKVITWVRESSIRARAEDLVPPVLEESIILDKGVSHYNAMCIGCHLAPGYSTTELATGLYPQAPLFYERVPVTDEEDKKYLIKKYFWVIKNGIKMTAMPAWGLTHDDESIWAMAHLVQRLHGMTAEQYTALVKLHGDDADDDHHHEEAARE